jgi:hypothetical protein
MRIKFFFHNDANDFFNHNPFCTEEVDGVIPEKTLTYRGEKSRIEKIFEVKNIEYVLAYGSYYAEIYLVEQKIIKDD